MSTALRQALADELQQAHRTRQPVAPLTARHPGLTLDDAYAIQLLQVAALTAAGGRVVGHKVGLTSQAMQELLGVHEPDYGHLLDDMVHADPGTGAVLDPARFLQPRVEPEIGFILGRRLAGPGVTIEQAADAVAYAVPALEIVDSRIADWRIGLLDTIADNASSGAVVLGPDWVPIDGLDLAAVSCAMTCNGQDAGAGTGAAVMGSPLTVLAWLANTLGPRGVTLEPGHVVIPGAVCAMIPVTAGDVVTAAFTSLGSVTARFEADHA